MPTIKDVAKMAGVSISTVSNAINNKNNVSEEKYGKIASAIKKLNYNPNFLASNLRNRKMKFIAVVIPNCGGIYGRMLAGIHNVLDPMGYNIILKLTDNSRFVENAVLDQLVNLGISGILLVTSGPDNTDKFIEIISKGIPLVFLEKHAEGADFSSVLFNNEQLVFDAVVDMLEDRHAGGNKTVCELPVLIVDKELHSTDEDCIRGFLAAYRKYGLDGGDRIIKVGGNTYSSFIDLAVSVPELDEKPRSFIAAGGVIAESLLEMLAIHMRRSSVYVLSGDGWTSYADKSDCIEIRRNATELGEKGAELLFEYIDSGILFENRQIIVDSKASRHEEVYPIKHCRGKTIRLLMYSLPSTYSVLKLMDDFKQNCGIDVEYEMLDNAPLHKKITELCRMKSSDADIFMLDYQMFSSDYDKGIFYELNGFLENDRDGFLDNFIPVVRDRFINYRSRIYTLPLLATTQFLFYRRDLFESAEQKRLFFRKYGIELRPPRTWTEYELVSEFFTRSFNEQSPVLYGASMQGSENSAIMHDFLLRQWAFRGRMLSVKNEVMLESVENKRALQSLCNSYRYSPQEKTGSWVEENKRILNGETAMMISFATHIPMQDLKDSAHTIMYDTIPGNCPGLGGWTIGINAYSEKAEESYRFIKWALSDKIAVQSTLLGGFVPKNCVESSALIKDCYPWIGDIADNIKIARKREVIRDTKGRIMDSNKMEELLSPCIHDAMTVKITVGDALSKMAGIVLELIKQ